ncbi:HEAT repeat domain-containing protein [Dysgonomonas sp. 520]|uniref:HEAT repeat domain-containing protein n=1 Tax=Dysgonomonas sp. 520 TaxID=2302931 RepID=UPI0013D5623A|nr:HEAT repeat domain-containing protein [Dysgonomonas sp. 520]NDW09993.1 HEAT repeat domain-containing protein [Dysgonomonas sp. 520]
MIFEYYLYYLYYTFLGFPFIIRVAVSFITVFIPILVFISFCLIYSRIKYYKKKKTKKTLTNKFGKEIKNIVYSLEIYSLEDIKTRLNFNAKKLNSSKKRILTNIILNIRAKEGDEYINEINYQNVIDSFGLREFWESKLKYGNLSSRQRALRKLDDFDIEIPGSMITSLTYNRNQYLRKRARSSFMYFSKSSPFKFLDEDFDKTFNSWDKVEIHRMLSRRVHEGLPNLSQWVKNSTNSDFQCFLVDEIKFFNQVKCSSHLLEMLDTHDINLRKHIIDALGEMRCMETEEHLTKDYVLQPQVVQHSIIRAVQNINSGKSLSFLEDAYNNAHDRESEIIILKAIFNYGSAGRKLFDSLKEVSGGFSTLIFEHVSNPLIKY